MNDLTAVIADLTVLVNAYSTRVARNGPGHPDNSYLADLAGLFAGAAGNLREAIQRYESHARLTRPETDPSASLARQDARYQRATGARPAFEVIAEYEYTIEEQDDDIAQYEEQRNALEDTAEEILRQSYTWYD